MKEIFTVKGILVELETPFEKNLSKWAVIDYNKTQPVQTVRQLEKNVIGIFPTVGEVFFFQFILNSLIRTAIETTPDTISHVDELRVRISARRHLGR